MARQSANTIGLDQLPEAARDRIEQLKLLFIERSKGNLDQIRDLLARRQLASDPHSVDADLIKLAHSLVGASGIFGFQQLGDAAFRLETLLRAPCYQKPEFERLSADLVEQLAGLGRQA